MSVGICLRLSIIRKDVIYHRPRDLCVYQFIQIKRSFEHVAKSKIVKANRIAIRVERGGENFLVRIRRLIELSFEYERSWSLQQHPPRYHDIRVVTIDAVKGTP